MIKVEDSKLELNGSLTEILTDSHVGMLGLLQFIRKMSDELTLDYIIETTKMFKGYTEAMEKGLSHDECCIMAIRSMEQ